MVNWYAPDPSGGTYRQNTGAETAGTTSTIDTKNIPQWLLPYVQSQAQAASSLTNAPITPYTGQYTAPITTEENRGIALAGALPGQTQIGLNKAADLYGQIGQYGVGGPSTAQLDAYTNPYNTRVMDVSRQRQEEAYLKDRNQLLGRLGQTASFGGSGSAIAESEMARNYQNQLAEQEAKQLYQNYQQAQEGVRAGMGLATGAASGTGQTAMQGQAARLADIGAQYTAGGLKRGIAQEDLDKRYQEFVRGQDQQTQQFTAGSNALSNILGQIVGGTTAGTSGESQTGFSAVTGTPNQLNNDTTNPPFEWPDPATVGPTIAPWMPGNPEFDQAHGGGGTSTQGGDLGTLTGGGGYTGGGGAATIDPLGNITSGGGGQQAVTVDENGNITSDGGGQPSTPTQPSTGKIGDPVIKDQYGKTWYQQPDGSYSQTPPPDITPTDPNDPNYVDPDPNVTSYAEYLAEMQRANQAAWQAGVPGSPIISEEQFNSQYNNVGAYRNGGVVGYAVGGMVHFDKKYLSPSGAPYSHSSSPIAMAKGGLVAMANEYHKNLVQGYANGGIVGNLYQRPMAPMQRPMGLPQRTVPPQVNPIGRFMPMPQQPMQRMPLPIQKRAMPNVPVRPIGQGMPIGLPQRMSPPVMTVQDRYRQMTPFAKGGIVPHYAMGGLTGLAEKYYGGAQGEADYAELSPDKKQYLDWLVKNTPQEGLAGVLAALPAAYSAYITSHPGEFITDVGTSAIGGIGTVGKVGKGLWGMGKAAIPLAAPIAKAAMTTNLGKAAVMAAPMVARGLMGDKAPAIAPPVTLNPKDTAKDVQSALDDIYYFGQDTEQPSTQPDLIDDLIKRVQNRGAGAGFDPALAKMAFEGGAAGNTENYAGSALGAGKRAYVANVLSQMGIENPEDKRIQLLAALAELKQKKEDSTSAAKRAKYEADIQATKDKLEIAKAKQETSGKITEAKRADIAAKLQEQSIAFNGTPLTKEQLDEAVNNIIGASAAVASEGWSATKD